MVGVMDSSQLLSPLSRNLRKWRLRRGFSASALAREANISKSTVSELERGQGNPSLDTLWALARALNVTLGAFFVGSPVPDETKVLRLVNASVIAKDGDTFVAQLLASWPGDGDVELSVVTLKAGARHNSQGNAPGVVERTVCVEGIVEVGTGEGSHALEPGDMMTFAADQRHFYQAVNGAAKLVVVQQYPRVSSH
jgi:transcriptional regulator with XRE-family HTH domain